MEGNKEENDTGRFCKRSVYISLGYQFQHTQAQCISCVLLFDLDIYNFSSPAIPC